MTYAEIIKSKKKDWKCDGLMDAATADRGQKIPFSSPLLNWATYGGIPRDAITEFLGEPGGGKTTTAVDICKNAEAQFSQDHKVQLDGLRDKLSKCEKTKRASLEGEIEDLEATGPKKVLYIDLEHSFSGAWAKTLGLDTAKVEIMSPPNQPAEEIIQMIIDVIETGEIGLIVLDSLPSLVTRAELEKQAGERTVASLANLLSIQFRKLVPLLTRYGTTFLFINQIRDNMDNPWEIQSPGGQVPRFYASLRVLFRRGSPVDMFGTELPKKSENPAGYLISALILKQKSAPFDRKVSSYYLMCTSGIRPEFDYAQLAINRYNIIKKQGGWFTVMNPYTGEVLERDGKIVKLNGIAKVFDFLQSDAEYFRVLKQYITDEINGTPSSYDKAEGVDVE